MPSLRQLDTTFTEFLASTKPIPGVLEVRYEKYPYFTRFLKPFFNTTQPIHPSIIDAIVDFFISHQNYDIYYMVDDTLNKLVNEVIGDNGIAFFLKLFSKLPEQIVLEDTAEFVYVSTFLNSCFDKNLFVISEAFVRHLPMERKVNPSFYRDNKQWLAKVMHEQILLQEPSNADLKALEYIIRIGKVKLNKMLITVNIVLSDKQGNIAMPIAAFALMMGSKKIAQILIANGADVRTQCALEYNNISHDIDIKHLVYSGIQATKIARRYKTHMYDPEHPSQAKRNLDWEKHRRQSPIFN